LTVPFYRPSLVIENISNKAVRLLGLTTILPGQVVELFDEVDPNTLYEDLILKGLEKPWGDLYNEVVIKKTLVIRRLVLASFYYGIVGPRNINSTNAYFPGAVPSAVDDDKFSWIAPAIASATPPLQINSGALSIPPASATADGYLTKEDWLLFAGNVKPPIKIWQYQDFSAPVSTSLTLTNFQNGTGLAFNPSYLINDTAVIVLSADSAAPPTTTLSIPAKYLPSNRVKVTSQIGTTVILNAAPESSLSCRVFYLIELPAGVPLPSGYQEDPEFLNDSSLEFADDNYVNQNQDETVFGEKTFADNILAAASIGVGTLSPTAAVDVIGLTRTTAFQMPTGAVDGYFLRGDGSGLASWAQVNSTTVAASAPAAPYPGQLWVKVPEYELYVYDGIRGKWLSPRTVMTGGARDVHNASNVYFYHDDGVASTVAPFIVPFDATIVGMSLSCRAAATWTGEVRVGLVPLVGAALTVNAATQAFSNTLNVDVAAGTAIQLYMNGSNISYPRVSVVLARRG
jgi:hypothetical protein